MTVLKMPFGLHKGTPVSDVPTEYLRYITNKMELKEPLRTAVELQLGLRLDDEERDRIRCAVENFTHMMSDADLYDLFLIGQRKVDGRL